MLNDWITLTRVKVSGADRLYPNGIDWSVRPGINAIVGGTGLGKTTLIYAAQFAIFGKLVVDRDRIERDFFADRMTKRRDRDADAVVTNVMVEFTAGGIAFAVERSLRTGSVTSVTCDGAEIQPSQYEKTLARAIGLASDTESLALLQEHLFFFGEGRYLLAWENEVQHQLISVMMSDHADSKKLAELWDKVKSADSEARNLSAQAYRIEQDIKELKAEKPTDELARRSARRDIGREKASVVDELKSVRKEIAEQTQRETVLNAKVATAYHNFHRQIAILETEEAADFDTALLHAALADPTVGSVRRSIADFYRQPDEQPCPCCNRNGMEQVLRQLTTVALARADSGNCVVCSKQLPDGKVKRSESGDFKGADDRASQLQQLSFDRAQVRARVEEAKRREAQLAEQLQQLTQEELDTARSDPAVASAPLQGLVQQLRGREAEARARCNTELRKLRTRLKQTNKVFKRIDREIADAFKKYARLYLDEECNVEFLEEESLPPTRGHQVKAPHSAFFPIVSGERRPNAQALSDAQRSFVDLAFRMALIEVWHKQTKKVATLFIETPEGAVDIAYMGRVARMLRTFSEQGHTLLVTTNLNNDLFLPQLMAGTPKQQRDARILNLLVLGNPRPVQKAEKPRFDRILDLVASEPLAK